MGIVLAILFTILGIAALILFSGTPHGVTGSCGPIHFFGHIFTIATNCRYVSIGEIVAAVVFFLWAITAALSARPQPRG